MFTQNILREIKALAKVVIMVLVGRYLINQSPTFFDIVIMYNITAVYERVNQSDFWIMRG